jgi:cytoskeleton protein RodZ
MSESQEVHDAVAGVNDAASAEDVAVALETQAPAAPAPSAGALLREAREAAGVDLMTLAQALKVSVKKIEALEADAYDRLPDAVFTRGLASSVCRALKIDPKQILERMPTSPTVRLAQEEGGLNTPFQTPGDVAKTPFLDQLSRPMILAALAILLGAIVLVFFPSAERRGEIGAIVSNAPSGAASGETTEAAASAAVMPAEPASSERPEVVPSSVAPTSSTPKPEDSAAASAARSPSTSVKLAPVVAAAPAPQTPVAAPAAVAAANRTTTPVVTPPAVAQPSVAATPPKAAVTTEASATTGDAPRKKLPGTGVVVFKTTGSSWVNVTDAQGAVLLSREVLPDEPVGVSGKMPLSISIGRADLTTVTVRGQPYDLAPVTKQGVARFELK